MKKLSILFVILLAAPFALAQTFTTTVISAQKLVDNNKNPLTGTITVTLTDSTNSPVTYTPQGGSPSTATFVANVVNGAIQPVSGFPFSVPAAATTSPTGIVYRIQTATTGATVVWTLPLTQLPTQYYSLDGYIAQRGNPISGTGIPTLPRCAPGAQYTDITATTVPYACTNITSPDNTTLWTQNPSQNPMCAQAVAYPATQSPYCLPSTQAYILPGYSIGNSGTTPAAPTAAQSGGTVNLANGPVSGTGTGATNHPTTAAELAPLTYAAASGSANAYVVTLSPVPLSLVPNMTVNFLPNAANTTTTPTINVNGLGAITITKNGASALIASDLTTTAIATVKYDGTHFQLENPQTSAAGGGVSGTAQLPAFLNSSSTATSYDPTLQGSNHLTAPDTATTIPYPFLFGQIPPGSAGVNTGIRNEGDSITFGVAAANNLGYAPQVDIYAGQAATLLNTAIPGSQACDTNKRMFNRWSPVTASWTIPQMLYDGTNDANQGGTGNHENIFAQCMFGSIAYTTSVLASTGGSVTPATNWATDTYFSQVTAVNSSTFGAVQTFPYTTTVLGQGIVVFYSFWDGNQGEASVADNGGATTSSIFGGSQPNNGGANINTLLGTTRAVGALYMPSSTRTAGSHLITTTVTSATGTQGGSGFASNPTVFFTSTCANTQATATATATSGSITVTLGTGGLYTCTPYAFVTGGGGVNAPLIATLAGGPILTVPVGYGGVYTSAPTLSTSECSGTGAVLTPTMTSTGGGNFTISAVVVTNGGTGFTCGPYISATGGGGGGATFGLPTITPSAVTSLTLDTSNQVSILGVAVVPPAITATTPAIWVAGQGRQQNDLFSASTAAYDSDIRQIVETVEGYGAAAYYINTRNCLQGNATDMIGIHPTTAGHAQLAACFERPAASLLIQSQLAPLTGVANPVNWLGPGASIASFPAYLQANQTSVQFTSACGTVYMPPAGSLPVPPGQVVQNRYYYLTNTFTCASTLSTAHGNSTGCGNVNGITLNQNQTAIVYSNGPCWYLASLTPPNLTGQTLTTTTLAGTNTTLSSNNLLWLNGADAATNIDIRAGLTADQQESISFANHSNANQWQILKDASSNFAVSDSVNSLSRLTFGPGTTTDIRSGGTSPIRFNFTNGGTGGIQVCNASSTCLFQVTGAGALTAPSYGQSAASSTGGTCTMSTTSCTITLGHTYTTPVCIAVAQGTNVTGAAASCSVSGTTVTITATTTNTNVWGAFVFGNPN